MLCREWLVLQEAFFSFSKKDRLNQFGEAKKLPDWAVRVAPSRGTDIVEVKTRAYSPRAAAVLGKTITSIYLKRRLDANFQANIQSRRFAETKMRSVEKELSAANGDGARFKEKSKLFAPSVQFEKLADYRAALEVELLAARTEILTGSNEAGMTRDSSSEKSGAPVESNTLEMNPRIAALTQDIDKLRGQRLQLLQEYTPQSDEVKAVDNQINEQEKRLSTIKQIVQAAAESRIGMLGREIKSQDDMAQLMPEKERQLTEFMQRVTLLQTAYEVISAKYYGLLLSEQGLLAGVQIVSPAREEPIPVAPRRVVNMVGFAVLSLLLAVVGALVAEGMDKRVRDQEAAERIANSYALATVPKLRPGASLLITEPGIALPFMESFRVLRNNLALMALEQPLKIIAITSALRSEGKSITSANLAAAMAMDGKQVVLVDGNLHYPRLRSLMKTPGDVGLTNAISGGCSLDKAVVPTNQENLFFLPTGLLVTNSSEFLNSQACRGIFKKLADDYDVVLIDCPSVGNLSDVQVISTIADGVLLVASMNQTRKPEFQVASRVLAQARAVVLGLVLNEVDMDLGSNGDGRFDSRSNYTQNTRKPALGGKRQ